MRRFAYAMAFLVVIGLVATGIFSRSAPPDGKALLISAAQAMEAATTIHITGQAHFWGSPTNPPWGELAKGHYEKWLTEDRERANYYGEDGTLNNVTAMDVPAGIFWDWSGPMPWFPKGLLVHYPIGESAARKMLAQEREDFLKGMVAEATSTAKQTRRETRGGRSLLVVVGEEAGGQSNGEAWHYTTEWEIDPVTRRLVAARQFGPESAGKPLVLRMEVEYDVPVPPGAMDPPKAAEALVTTGDFERTPDGAASPLSPTGSLPEEYRLKPSAGWHVSSSAGGNASAAIDDDPKTFWTARGHTHLQDPGLWFEVAFDEPLTVSNVLATHLAEFGGSGNGWPRGAQVSYTSDGATWHEAYTGQAGAERGVLGVLDGVTVKAIRITLTEASDEATWQINDLQVYFPHAG